MVSSPASIGVTNRVVDQVTRQGEPGVGVARCLKREFDELAVLELRREPRVLIRAGLFCSPPAAAFTVPATRADVQ